jgi:glycosyltransferase involved in cell wall biosynthesis
MNMPILDVSVVIPCFNTGDTLKRCLDSVLNQIELPIEIILVDDGSEIPVELVVTELYNNCPIPVRILTQANRGAPAARNAGINIAVGRYIAFLDADDIWFPEKLKIQYAVMVAECLTICGHGYAFQDDPSLRQDVVFNKGRSSHVKLAKWRFVCGNPLFTPTVMISKNDFSGFDERFRRVDDYKAWLENFYPERCGYINTVMAAGFKPPIGHSGLTGSLEGMHEGYIDVLKALLNESQISLAFYSVARFIEALKFPIRRQRAKKLFDI